MNTCLNPEQRHYFLGNDPLKCLCPEPGCGFLLEGAWIKQWRIVSLLKHNELMALYVGESAGEQRFQHTNVMVRVLRSPSPELLARLRLLSRLYHPHIHPLLAVGEVEPAGPLSLVEHFEARGSLAHMLAAHTPTPFVALAAIVTQIADALFYAHAQQLIHGHLKPENCLLTAPGKLQVCDFYTPFSGSTPDYPLASCIAPEQIQGSTQPASDQFALAALIYHLLRQCSPFARWSVEGEAAMLYGVAPQPFLGPSHPLDLTLRRALSPNPAERFPDIRTFALMLSTTLRQLKETSSQSVLGGGYELAISANQPSMENSGSLLENSLFPATQYQKRISQARQGAPPVFIPGNVTQLGLLPGHTAALSSLAWEKRSRLLASGSEDGEIRIWTFQGNVGRLGGLLQGHQGKVRALCWSPDGSALATGSSDSALRIWKVLSSEVDKHSLERSWWGHDGEVTALSWYLDGNALASGGKDGTLRCWTRQGELLGKQQAHSKGVRCLTCSPNGSWIATGGADQTICVWNAKTRQKVHSWHAHNDEVRHLQWSPDSQLLASAGGKKDPQLCLWHVDTGKCLATVTKQQREIVGLAWSNDGSCLVFCAPDGLLYAWRVDRMLDDSSPLFQPESPLDLQETPQIMSCDLDNRILAIATKTLSVIVFALR